LILYSGGTSYEVKGKEVFVLPREIKMQYAEWNSELGKYITLSRIYTAKETIIEPVLFDEFLPPSESPLSIRYSGNSAEKFLRTLRDILAKYHQGKNILRLPMHDRLVLRFAIMLARMAELSDISNV